MSDRANWNALAIDGDVEPPAPRANRPTTIGARAEYALARALFAVFRVIGVDAASAVAGRFTRLVGPLLSGLSNRARDNLRRAYPDWSEAEIERTVRSVWENLGRTAAEFAHLDALDPARGRVVCHGTDIPLALKEAGRPAIYVSAHLANWEALTIALTRLGVDYAVVYRAANNPLVDAMIIAERARWMTRRQIPKGKRGGRDLIAAVKDGRSLAMLVDQKLNDGVPAPFFGRTAMTAPAAARLSLKHGAPIVPAAIFRHGGARFDMHFREPIDFEPSGDFAQDILALTARVNEAIEMEIRRAPAQWLWLHRRWPKDEG
ncbi:MAG: lysophospholipid acyltransferase family protein [Parvularculaceae bacterium]